MSSPAPGERPPSFLPELALGVAFALLCGMVGPVFIVLGLSIDDPDTDWMLPVGCAVIALDVVIGVLIARYRYRAKQRRHELRHSGRRARATVLSAEATTMEVNAQPVYRLRLRIHGDDVTPFEVERRKVVRKSQTHLLHGDDLPVLVDPETQDWEIDWFGAERDASRALAQGAGSGTPAALERSRAERLSELDELLRADLLSRDEYDDERSRILGEI
ncbi:hypothetical protein KG112_09520 [Nocardioides sp. zg-ZUI104]|uniref:hypothetical protein n=1 Tax=Nocardioides faecalis TaxID=2803858 RepID=UPI001BD03149|nr:hypothetical protein [Nocardioides faecalis]MBS4753041.1 hypothetical protein [Nocardioides faecalis]